MEYRFETRYNSETMAVMAKALRKTVRKRHSRRSHTLGWGIAVLGGGLALFHVALDFRTVIALSAVFAIVVALLFEDRINGAVAAKRLLPGTEQAVTVFSEEGFVSATQVGRTEWSYDKIEIIAEIGDFFVFVFSANHGQLYDKRRLTGGSEAEFRCMIQRVTGKEIQKIS